MKTLTGSAKQIAWAADIRDKAAASIAAALTKASTATNSRPMPDGYTAENIAATIVS